MAARRLHRVQGSPTPSSIGVVSGYTLKLLRESVGQTQVAAAEAWRVDLTTIQGWESGRRPLTSLKTSDLLRLRSKLLRIGVSYQQFNVLREAMEADMTITELSGSRSLACDRHVSPLSAHVHRRTLTSLITWPFTGIVPDQLRPLKETATMRRGPVADRPILDTDIRSIFFDNLLAAAESANVVDGALLRRQATFLLGFDTRSESRSWIENEHRRCEGSVGASHSSASWAGRRSAAVAAAYAGDRGPLQAFLHRDLQEQRSQLANLNYWAYWVGEIAEAQPDDSFMDESMPSWSGTRLFTHLVDKLDPHTAHIELTVRSLWTLAVSRPDVPRLVGRAMRAVALRRIELLLDVTSGDPAMRQELRGVGQMVRAADW
jgi:hypothetical protein